ncbi:dihydrodipicolinate synthase family protein [Pelagibacterium lacus]|uniref:Dihydrodipicolinate synthase family protein n=1 Tax=Pelagibacterium lacus TaxID=2282655 RepID=A0A369W6A4_9HYPH|nr:dihydrodipicolinate synthase family protein [Pelagibacterium lacus]RDE09549.1 dihydrodipicolinate synthase family protein [Pelagibacterium lacus]
MKLNEQARGVYVIAATPFDDNGAVDQDSINSMVDGYLAAGVSGITILGMMGEANKLSEAESKSVITGVLNRVDQRVPVVVGVSSAGLDPLVALSKFSMDAGAAGVMATPIPSIRTDEALYGYFERVCNAIGSQTPLVFQDYPFVTSVHASVPVLERLIDDFAQIVMIKHEDWPGLSKLTRLRAGSDSGAHRRVSILVGNGGMYLPPELGRGADGAMTGFAYPEMLVDVCDLYSAGKAEQGEDLFDLYLPLLRYEAQPGIGLALRKELLRRRGLMASSYVRAPGPRLSKEDHAELDSLVARLERSLHAAGIQPRNLV